MNPRFVSAAAAAALALVGAASLPAQVIASAAPASPPASVSTDSTPASAAKSAIDKAAADKAAADKAAAAKAAAKAAEKASMLPPIEIQHIRPVDARGLNVFEPPKDDTTPFTGFKLNWGASFAQQFQGLTHHNTAAPKMVNGVDANQLISIGNGFNNATANLYTNAQMARGIRVALTTYLSARHHQEAWVKDGYLLVDASPIDVDVLNSIMKYLTLRVGHFEIDYGDAHYRRSDNGNAMYNPLVGNYIMDAFTTEIGAEAYVRANGLIAMAGMTGGEVHGQVTAPGRRSPSILGKLGFDEQLTPDLRVRLTGSLYQKAKSVNNTLYSGDRAGSRYYDVLENTASTETANAWSGAIQPGLSSKVRAIVVNPFIKFGGLELFGNVEQAQGRSASETVDRKWTQNVGEVTYRFLDDQLYVTGRYDAVKGRLAGQTSDVKVDRSQFGGGWFVTPGILLKGEYVNQLYQDFPLTDIRHGGQFKGFMMEGVVGF